MTSSCSLHHRLISACARQLQKQLAGEYGSVQDALYYAAKNGKLALLHASLQAGAQVDCKFQGCSALMMAAIHGNEAEVKALLQVGTDKESRDYQLFTPIGRAAEYGQTDVVRALIAAHVDVDAPNFRAQTPLMFSITRGHFRITEALVAAGANTAAVDVFGHDIPYFVSTYVSPHHHKKYCDVLSITLPEYGNLHHKVRPLHSLS